MKKLFPVVVAAAVWVKHLSRPCVEFQSDNQAVIAAVSSRSGLLATHKSWTCFIVSFSCKPTFGLNTAHDIVQGKRML